MGDGVIGTADCSVTMIQNILLSGQAFNKLSVFGKFMPDMTFIKVTEDNK